VATDGTLVYADAQGSLATDERTLVWVDRAGKEEPVAAPPRASLQPRLSPDGTRRVTPLLQTTFDEREGVISPDGRWLAYESNRSGSFEVYVRPFPNVGSGQWRVSQAGGTRPLWAKSGKELFYVGANGSLLGVPVEAKGATWNHRTPMKLFERRYYVGPNSGRSYDVSPEGQRFLMITVPTTDAGTTLPTLIIVQHWDEELKRLVPTK
jgi:eukaryotic-like serine/threonine-protein kinase